ncbi:MAG: hypothetical protein Q9162_000883 [Coniocarpon cinnabarinum]
MSSADILKLAPEILKQIPAASPPPGIVSNLNDPYDKGNVLVIVSTIFLAIGLTAYIIRLFAKVFLLKKFFWDDVTLTLGVYNYLATAFLTITLLFLKISVLLMYYQIFWPMRWLRIEVYLGGTIACIFYGTLTIYQLVVQTPRNGVTWPEWEFGPEQPKVQHVSLPTGVFGVIMDVFLLVLPIPAVLKLQMPTKKKVGVLCVFATGLM